MKKHFLFQMLLTVFICFTVTENSPAQSIYFTNPVNGQTVHDALNEAATQTTIPLNLEYGWELSNDPNLIGYYIKLFPPPYPDQQSNIGNGIDQWWYLPPATYTWRLELWETYLGQGSFKVAEQTITFYIKHTIIVTNNFYDGTVNIDGETKSSGSSSFKITGENLSVGAIDQQSGNYYRVWNQSGINNSKWQRKPMNAGNFQPIYGGTTRNFNYTVASNDNGAEIQGVLKKRYDIYRDDQTEFDGTVPAGVIANIVEQNSGQISAPIQRNINGKDYRFVWWKDDHNLPMERTITPTDNETYTTLYKYPHHSNNTDAYKNNSQRKFIRTPDGKMYITYESMGYIWVERSTDNGQNWIIMNDGKPLNTDEAKLPSMDYRILDNAFVVVWQEKWGTDYKIRYAVYRPDNNTFRIDDAGWEPPGQGFSDLNANPVVGWSYGNKALFVWEGITHKLYYSFCILNPPSTHWLKRNELLRRTGQDYYNPTVYVRKDMNSDFLFHLAWQHFESDIYYQSIHWDELNGRMVYSNLEYPSVNDGYSKNYAPSITGKTVANNEEIKLTWIGYRKNFAQGPIEPLGETKVLFKSRSYSFGWSSLYVYGDDVKSVSVNKSDDENSAFAWSQISGSSFVNKYVRIDEIPTTIRTLSTTGKDLQVNNGTTLSSMFANSFQSQTSPYSFSLSGSLSGEISKLTGFSIFRGREGVVAKDTAQFYFAIGDITLNGDNIDFVEIDDTVNINSRQMLNSYLVSLPFTVNDNSTLSYGVQYGITDSASAVAELSDGSTINFRVQLIDEQTGEVLGLFDSITYSQDNVFQYNNIGYEVDMTGIGSRTVRFKLIINTDADCEYSLSKRYADEEILGKSGKKQVKYQGSLAVTDYAIEQNFPNPFNPSTTIKYQLPQNGLVTLKIYDILGKEVATLVNSEQQAGRYEVNFNASNLASGVYLYRIKANDYVAVKKMLLLK